MFFLSEGAKPGVLRISITYLYTGLVKQCHTRQQSRLLVRLILMHRKNMTMAVVS